MLTSYNVSQDIELKTNDFGLVDRFDVTLNPGDQQLVDIDTVLTKSGAQYSYQVSRVTDGKCQKFANSTPTCPCHSRRSSNCMYCLRFRMPSKPAR